MVNERQLRATFEDVKKKQRLFRHKLDVLIEARSLNSVAGVAYEMYKTPKEFEANHDMSERVILYRN